MNITTRFRAVAAALLLALLTPVALAQSPTGPLEIKAVAEVESKTIDGGRQAVKLIPADRVVPGDRVLYTLEVRNAGTTALDTPIVIQPVPEHMRYVADTAVGPGADVTYSVDGGHTFDRAENLKVTGSDGNPRLAVAADYTHIRWQLKNSLKVNSTAFVRFRALVK